MPQRVSAVTSEMIFPRKPIIFSCFSCLLTTVRRHSYSKCMHCGRMSTNSNYFFEARRRAERFIKGTPHKSYFFDSPLRWAFSWCFEDGYLSIRMSYNAPAFLSEFRSHSAARERDFGRKIVDVVNLGAFLSGNVCFFGVGLTKSRRE